jgi:effector-binding domain-containing protein
MKRLLIPVCLIIVLALIALIQITEAYKLNINSSYYNVYQNLATAKGWVKWYPGFKDKGYRITRDSLDGFNITSSSSSVVLQKKGLGAFDINVTQGYDVSLYNCYVTVSDTMGISKLDVSRQVNVYKYLWLKITDTNQKSFIYSLKNYLEDTRQYYGYIINKQVTNEKLMIVKREKSINEDICPKNRALLKDLLDVSVKEDLSIIGPVQLQYVTSIKDSTEIMVGLPIAKKQGAISGVQYMPAPGGKVLVGYFKGKYKDRQKLYQAMSLYIADHYLHANTKPFEKFENNQLPSNEETIVSLKVIIPYI